MSPLDRLAERLLDRAVRRWPADLRDDHSAAWRAEMHAITAEPALSPASRAFARLRFAFSLAASPPAEDENGVPRGWRELLPAWGGTVWPGVLLFGLGVLAPLLGGLLRLLAGFVTEMATPGDRLGEMTTGAFWTGLVLNAALLVAAAVLLVPLGVRIGRVLPLTAARPTVLGRVGTAVLAVALVSAGAAVGTGAASLYSEYDWTAAALCAAACAVGAAVAVLLRRPLRPLLSGALGLTVSLGLFELAAVVLGRRFAATPIMMQTGPDTFEPMGPMVAPETLGHAVPALWFPLSLGSPDPYAFLPGGQPFGEGDIEVSLGLSGTMGTFLLVLTFTVAYALRASWATRAPARDTAAAVVPAVPASGVAPRVRVAALACTVVAMGLWAYTVAFTTSRVEPFEADPEFMLWGYELREAAILLGLLSLALALNGRGRPLVHTLIGGGVLLVTDVVLDANAIPDPLAFGIAAFTALGVCTAIRLLVPALAGTGPSPTSARRGRALIALLAAYQAPVLFLQSTWPDTTEGAATPPELTVGTSIVTALLVALGLGTALTVRERPLSTVASTVVVGVPAVLMAGLGTVSGTPGIARWFMLAAGLALPLGVFALALMRWNGPRRPVRVAILWALVILASAPVMVPIVVVGLYGGVMATPLLDAAGIGIPFDGLPFFSGVLVCGLPFVLLAAWRTEPGPRPPLPGPEPRPLWDGVDPDEERPVAILADHPVGSR